MAAGRVLIYELGAGGWTFVKAFVGGSGDQLGRSLALGNSILVAGAPQAGLNGEVQLYVRGSQWTHLQTIESPALSQDGALFGTAVALEDDWLAIGSPLVDKVTGLPGSEPVVDVGAVYLYTNPFVAWELATLLRPPEVGAEAYFGSSVAMHGIALVAGATNEVPIEGTGQRAGTAYLYLRSGAVWRARLRLVDSTAQASGLQGAAVALGDLGVLVGAPLEHAPGHLNQGAVLFYKGIVPFFDDGFENGDFSAWAGKTP
jgi:hypothetical protein